MAEVRLNQITKRYREIVAVDDASLAAESGRFLSLLGPSGCGKTTILRLIAGFESPNSGSIEIDGANVLDLPPERRQVGMVFQSYALFPHMNVARNIAYGLRNRPRQERDRRVTELLEQVGLSGYGTRQATELSAGEQQRVALARALAPAPRVVLLDEPLSALDASLRDDLRVEIRRIQQDSGLTMIYVTHDQEEALGMSDRIAVMAAGRMEQVGTPQAVYLHPQTPFVASFVGRSNRMQGTVLAVDPERVLIDLGPCQVEAASVDAFEIGDRAVLYVKPEHVQSGSSDAEGIEASVSGTEYAGRHTSVDITTPVGTLRMVLPGVAPLQPGDPLHVQLDPQQTLAFRLTE